MEVLTILHTNDFHSRLTPVATARLRELRQELGGRGLLLDAGDAVASGNVTFRPGGETILDAMSQIGYDAMTVGNREFHFSKLGFETKLSLATFPVLCANINLARAIGQEPRGDMPQAPHQQSPDSPDRSLPVAPFIVRELPRQRPNPFRVVVLGLTVPMITERMASRHISHYLFTDPIAVAKTLVPRLLREYQPDLLVALTHIGIARDRELAQAVPGLDLIIGGHTHVVLEHGERVGDTLIVQAGSHGRFVGRVAVLPASGAGGRPGLSALLEPLC